MRSSDAGGPLNAVFVVGVGRSGTTMVYDMLALSKRHRWLSRVEAQWPSTWPLYPAARHDHRRRMRLGERRGRWLAPSEAYAWWNRLLPRFASASDGVMGPLSLEPHEAQRVSLAIRELIRGDLIFLNKNTRNSRRIGMLTQLPGICPRIVHVVRHPLAVALSLTRVSWWPGVPLWFRGGLTPSAIAGRDLAANLALAAELWRLEIQSLHAALAEASAEVVTIRYEDIAAEPARKSEELAAFSLADQPEEMGRIASAFIRPIGHRPPGSEVPAAELNRLWALVESETSRYGYERL